MVEQYFIWLASLDQTSSILVFVSTGLFLFIVISFVFRFLSQTINTISSNMPTKDKKTLLSKILNLIFNKKEIETEQKESVLEIAKTIDSNEVLIIVSKIVRYKDREKSLEKDYMARSMQMVENSMNTCFDGIIKEMIYQSNKEFYDSNTDTLNLASLAVSKKFNEKFKDAIRENHLQEYVDLSKRREYISSKIVNLINDVSASLSSVIKKLADDENTLFLSYLESSIFAERFRKLFSDILDKLITYAIEREVLRQSYREELIYGMSSSEGVSKSAIDIIKDILDID